MRKIHGMSLFGMVFTIAVIVCLGIVVMRISVVYIKHYTVVSSLQSLDEMPSNRFSNDPLINSNLIRKNLMKRFEINSIEDIEPKQIMIKPKDRNQFQVSIKYRVETPLVYNISLLFKFDVSQEVNIAPK